MFDDRVLGVFTVTDVPAGMSAVVCEGIPYVMYTIPPKIEYVWADIVPVTPGIVAV